MSSTPQDMTDRTSRPISEFSSRTDDDGRRFSRAQSEFLANMSHEIRTPMTAILGYADILAGHLKDPDNRKCVEVIKRNGRFLLDIVDDILDLSRIEAGKLRISPERFRLDQLVADIRSLMEVRAQEKSLPLVIEYDGQIPKHMVTDPTRLRQILINLISNAIKFTEQGSVRLRISYLGARNRGKPKWRFDVIDTGIGIDAMDQQEIFNPFSQVDASMTREYEGSGLGLSISQRLAEMLNGEILIDSVPGYGSTFSLTLETASVASEMITPAHEISTDRSAADIARRHLDASVLVVDDRRDIRYLVQYVLEEAGCRVLSAENGRAALDLIDRRTRHGRPTDLILMDMQMPVLDGFAATRILRDRGYRRPIIALTADAMHSDRQKALDAGCDAHVTKPIDSVALVNLVAQYLDDSGDPAHCDPDGDDGMSKRILVVDDSLDSAEALMILLKMAGHEVRTAGTGADALAVASDFVPEIVILDLGLPDIDGYSVAQRLRAEILGDEATVVALSGRDPDHDRLKRSGIDQHFMKPADIVAIQAMIAGDDSS